MTERWHGTLGGYTNHKCRCDACRAENTAYIAGAKARRHADRIIVDDRLFHPQAPHGTTNGYGNYGCRCRYCTTAHTDDALARRERKAAA